MRIAYVCADPGIPVFGSKGCSVHVQEMVRAFLRRGARVDLFAARCDGEKPTDFRDVRLLKLNGFEHPNNVSDTERLHQANEKLQDQLNRNGPYDLIYERYSLWSFAGMRLTRSSPVPGILEVNAPLIEEQARYRELTALDFAKHVAEQVFGGADAICAVSTQIADYLETFSAARGRVHVIPNGVDPERFPPRSQRQVSGAFDSESEQEDSPGQTFTVGFVGSLKPWHGLATLAESFAALHRAHPDSRLLIVGDGPERENLLAQLSSAGEAVLKATTLTGAVPTQKVAHYLNRMDVGVAPYPALANFYFSPMKIFEYMAAGLPVVASRVGDLSNTIREGIDGVFFTPNNAWELKALLKRLHGDSGLRHRLGTNARTAVLRQHTWEKNVERVLSLAGVTGPSFLNF